MTSERTHEDFLREQYFRLVPDLRRIAWYLESQSRYFTRDIFCQLKPHEQLVITVRIKECESAIKSLRRRQEADVFDPEKPSGFYSLLKLPDLVGIRALVFPRSRLIEVDDALGKVFQGWKSDPVLHRGETLAYKYVGFLRDVSDKIRAEYQVVPMLIGLYWDVEHSAIYKPAPNEKVPKQKADSEPMNELNADVVRALLNFETEYERLKQSNA